MSTEWKWILVCAALAIGEVAGFAASAFSPLWPFAATCAALAALAGFGLGLRAWPFAAAFLAGVALALASADSRRRVLDAWRELGGGLPRTAILSVGDDCRVLVADDGARTAVFSADLEGVPVRVRVSEGASGGVAPSPGETWACTGWLGGEGEGRLFGGRRRTFWVRGRGALARRVGLAPGGFAGFLRRLRADLSRRAGLGLAHDPLAADLDRAMLLGERARIPPSVRDVFADAGTVHLFAISGLHVLFVARLLMLSLVPSGLPLRWMGIAAVPLLWMYVLLVGAGPSSVRAAMTASLLYSAPVFWRRANGMTAWAVSFLATYVRSPESIYDVGCTLSFAVMFALCAWGGLPAPFRSRWTGRVGFTAAAWAAGVPIAAHVFGRFSVGGLFANLVAVPLAAASVSASALGVAASYASARLAGHLNNFAALSTNALAGISRAAASAPGVVRLATPWSLWECAAWYGVAVAAVLAARAYALRRRVFGG